MQDDSQPLTMRKRRNHRPRPRNHTLCIKSMRPNYPILAIRYPGRGNEALRWELT